jgi:hypothetical protein
MVQKDDKSFRIVIDKRIVRAFEDIPETFSIKQLIEVAKIPVEEQKSMYDVLERMCEYGLIKKSRDRSIWHKDPDYKGKKGFENWLMDYYEHIKETKER